MRNPFKRNADSRLADAALFRSVATRRKRRFTRRWQWYVAGALVVVLGLGGLATYLYFHYQGHFQDPRIRPTPAVPGEPFNVLLVGSDSRRGLTEKEQLDLGASAVPGERADTLILAHVVPASDRVTMVQFPRDLYVPLPGGKEGRINSALEEGPANLLRAVQSVTGVPINNYIQVNIAGFRDVVDAIGGVEVCITEPVPFDPATGIEITEDELGMVPFDGDRALRFVRSRKVFAGGDFARIQNQQKFLAAALDKVLSVRTFFDPLRIKRLLDTAGKNLTTDANTSIRDLRRILYRFRSFSPERYEAYTAPNKGVGMVGEASVVMSDDVGLRALFGAIERNESPTRADGVPPVDPSTIALGVYNAIGSASPHAAANAAKALVRSINTEGRTVDVQVVTDAAVTGAKHTVVRYRRATKPEARLLAAAIPGAKLKRAFVQRGLDVSVHVGTRFRTRRVVQLVPLDIPPPRAEPEECRSGVATAPRR